jgi:hypothetical protein
MTGHHSSDTPPPTAGGFASVPWSVAATATLHCLTGCAIGEVAGMVIGTGGPGRRHGIHCRDGAA